jgi:hypothetical protein
VRVELDVPVVPVLAAAELQGAVERLRQVGLLSRAPEAVARTFSGYGPIPAAVRSELADGSTTMVKGSVRRVHNADGSVVEEEILELSRPREQRYRIRSGLRPPFSWLVTEGSGHWLLTAHEHTTHIRWTFEFRLRTALAWPLVALLKVPFQKAMQRALGKTRALLEAG